MPDYERREMSGVTAMVIIQDLLTELSSIDVDDLTTFELQLIHRCAENPPSKQGRGCETKILD